MKLLKSKLVFALVVVTCLFAHASAAPVEYQRDLTPGIKLLETVDSSVPLSISALKIDLKQNVTAKAFVANNLINAKGREVVTSAIERTGALAGVNGDFFPFTSDPLGLAIIDGAIVSDPWPTRPAIGITQSGQMMFGIVKMALTLEFPNGKLVKANGIDRSADIGEIVIYDKVWGRSTSAAADACELVLQCDWARLVREGSIDAVVKAMLPTAANTPLPDDGVIVVARGPRVSELVNALGNQTTAKIKLVLQDEEGRSWLGVANAVGGGSWLVKNNAIYDTGTVGGFGKGFTEKRHPRTAAGVTKNGSLLLLVVDGRQIISRGATTKELAQMMLDRGCTDAINLDGGGSSTLAVKDLVINSPSDGQQRAVASGLLVFGPPESKVFTDQTLTITPSGSQILAGKIQAFQVAKFDGSNLTSSEMNRVVWGTRNGGGHISQDGVFTGLRTGSHDVRVRLMSDSTTAASRGDTVITVEPSGPGSVTARWDVATPVGSESRRLMVVVKDSIGNVSPYADITVTVTGGTADPPTVKCGPDGAGSISIVWDSEADAAARSVQVAVGSISTTISDK